MKVNLSTIKDSTINVLKATGHTVMGASVAYIIGQLAGAAYRVQFPAEKGNFDLIAPAIFASSFYGSYRLTNGIRKEFKLNDLFDSSINPIPKRTVCFAAQLMINTIAASFVTKLMLQALEAPYKLSCQDYAIFSIASAFGILVHRTIDNIVTDNLLRDLSTNEDKDSTFVDDDLSSDDDPPTSAKKDNFSFLDDFSLPDNNSSPKEEEYKLSYIDDDFFKASPTDNDDELSTGSERDPTTENDSDFSSSNEES